MTFSGWLQIAIYAALVILITKPFGGYMTRVFNGERTPLRLVLRPIEVGIYKLCGVRGAILSRNQVVGRDSG